jgi:hypothetical protein
MHKDKVTQCVEKQNLLKCTVSHVMGKWLFFQIENIDFLGMKEKQLNLDTGFSYISYPTTYKSLYRGQSEA